MVEGPLLLAKAVGAFAFHPVAGKTPEPVAHLTVRAKDGIWLNLRPRASIGRAAGLEITEHEEPARRSKARL